MRTHHLVGITLATLAGLGIGGSTAATATTSTTSTTGTPTELAGETDTTTTVDELVAPGGGREESTTCEGTVTCRLLEGACGAVGGTYTGWTSHDRGHDHTHGICTWPWE